jgi:hypothetical protein
MSELKENRDAACTPSPTRSPTNMSTWTGSAAPACIELTQAYEIAKGGEAERAYQEERCVINTDELDAKTGLYYAKIGYGGVNELWNNEISKITGSPKECLGVGGGEKFEILPASSPGYQNPSACSGPNSLEPGECYAKLTYSPDSIRQCIHSPSQEVCDREYRKANLKFQRRGLPPLRPKCKSGKISNAERISWTDGYDDCNHLPSCTYPAAYVGSQISVVCKKGYAAYPNSSSMCVKRAKGDEPEFEHDIKCINVAEKQKKEEEQDELELKRMMEDTRRDRRILSSWTVEESSAVSQVGLLNNDFNEEESQELIPEKKEEKPLFDKISQFMWF